MFFVNLFYFFLSALYLKFPQNFYIYLQVPDPFVRMCFAELTSNSFGVGERLITARSQPVLGGIYKLVALEFDAEIIPKFKISESEEKIANPAFKKLYSFFHKTSHKAIADFITLHDEEIDESKPLEIFNPVYTWKKKKLKNYHVKDLMVKIFENGQSIYESPSVMEIKEFSAVEVSKLWSEVLRLENPHEYYVDFTPF